MKTKIAFTSIALLFAQLVMAQDGRKIWLSSYARGVVWSDAFSTENDTLTPGKLQNGHALADLGLHIKPNNKVEVHAMLRVRNDYGGFWGSGVTFDLRQLWIRGIIGNAIRFQLGDLDYRLTPYTFQNEEEWILRSRSSISTTGLDFIRYDLFQSPNETWRQQGVAFDFGFNVKKYLKEVNFQLFTTRIAASDFNQTPDRLFSGGSAEILLPKGLGIKYNRAQLFDVAQTARNTVNLNNPVNSIQLHWEQTLKQYRLGATIEGGRSVLEWTGDSEAPRLTDGFLDAKLSWRNLPKRLSVQLNYREVGANFRSSGAQTKRIRAVAYPLAIRRYTNEQVLRPMSTFDLLRDASLYNTQLQAGLMPYDPLYGNATPYGLATPNRRGVNGSVHWENANKSFNTKAKLGWLSDIAGQGTDLKRGFTQVEWEAEWLLDKMFGWKQSVVITPFLLMESTSRDKASVGPEVSLNNQMVQVGAEWGFYPRLSLLAEWRLFSAVGSDLYALRNDYSEVVDFVPFEADRNEQMMGAGLQYELADRFEAQLFYQRFNWSDSKSALPEYNWGNWQLNIIMNL